MVEGLHINTPRFNPNYWKDPQDSLAHSHSEAFLSRYQNRNPLFLVLGFGSCVVEKDFSGAGHVAQ